VDLLVDQLVAEDVLEEAAMLTRYRVDLPLGVSHNMHRIDVEVLKLHQISERFGSFEESTTKFLPVTSAIALNTTAFGPLPTFVST
jgi:hypothetical protein